MKSKQGRGLSLALGAAVLVVSVLFVSLGILYRTTTDSAESWYIQINNDLVTEITPHGGMNYRYPVTAYDEGGGSRTVDFDTSRVLRDGACLRLEIAAFRGVISWEEVAWAELPAAVQSKLKTPE